MKKKMQAVYFLLSITFLILFIGSQGTYVFADENPTSSLVEVMWVPVDGSSDISGAVLQKGVVYKLKISGTFSIGGPGDGLADAEYADFSNPPDSVLDKCGDGSVDLGVGINDDIIDDGKFPHWGKYNSDHVYDKIFIGRGNQISVNYHDCNYADNSGSLFLEIYRLSWESAYSTLFESPSELERLRTYRDKILSRSASGSEYKSLLYENSAVALQVLLDNPALLAKAKVLIEKNKYAVTEVLEGREGVIRHTDDVISFLNSYAKEAPPNLSALIYLVKTDMEQRLKEGRLFLGFSLL